MKTKVLLLVLFCCCISCKEEVPVKPANTENTSTDLVNELKAKGMVGEGEYAFYRKEDPTEFNNSLLLKRITDEKEVVTAYYGERSGNNPGTYQFTTKTKKDDIKEITFLHTNIPGGSVQAVQLIMTLKKENDGWKVLEIYRAWSCYNGKGHRAFTAEDCL